ncbi:TPA: phage tail protein [Escherichia coli]|nr:phage tail protein [Escherichia coli]HDQ1520942.1 phage tail protein [Escherichia coli]
MTVKYYAILTNQGAARLANATMLGSKLNLTQMAVGDANGVLPTPDPAQTKLINQKRIAPLNLLSVDPNNQSQIIAEQIIPENEGGFWIREIGLYDDEGVLIAVANCPETYKPQLQEGSGRTQTIRMILVVTNTEAITLKIDPSVVLATRKYVDDEVLELRLYVDDQMRNHIAAQDPHTQYAQKHNPTFTGEPKAPTPDAGNNTTRIATTAFVQAAITALINGAPATLDTLKEIAAAINNDPKFSTTINNALALKAPLSSPALTGTPTAPTAAQSVNNTQIATTAFVKSAIAAMVGSAPAALDTLNELAAALGNDPNFSTTVLNALAGKQPLDNTLTNLSGKDVAGLLAYLGLGDGSGRLINCQVFKSSGKYTPTKGTRFIIVEIVGGGGAGGGCQVGYPNNAACGGGGMSGEYVKARVDNPTVTTVTIGYGGTGASASVGAPGGTTSFGNTIIAKGGLGGNVLAEGTVPGVVGPYGAYIEPGFTGANIIGSGSGYNSPGVRFSGSLAIGGPGGDSILGAGAGAQAIVGEGINANGYGGGGGGACVYGGATQQRSGGSGMAGIAIIWEYA